MTEPIRRPIVFVNTAGENSRTAKLTDELVLALRRERPSRMREWLDERGSKAAVDTARAAMNGRTWTHLPKSGIR
jgi:hypothetical protein